MKGFKRLGAVVFALSLVTGLLGVSAPVEAAAKKSVYVLTKQTESTEMDGESFASSAYTYTYTNNGLIKKCGSVLSTYKYTYSGTQLTKLTETPLEGYESIGKSTYKYTYDKKNRVKKYVETTVNEDGSKTIETSTFGYDSKGRIKTNKIVYSGTIDNTVTYKYTYNSKSQLTKISVISENSNDTSMTYTYDSKGQVKKEVMAYTSDGTAYEVTTTSTYTYDKNGNVKKKVSETSYSDTSVPTSTNTYTYTYKKISVPAKKAALVKEQQKKIFEKNVLTF